MSLAVQLLSAQHLLVLTANWEDMIPSLKAEVFACIVCPAFLQVGSERKSNRVRSSLYYN